MSMRKIPLTRDSAYDGTGLPREVEPARAALAAAPSESNRGAMQAIRQARAALHKHSMLPWGWPNHPISKPASALVYEAQSYLDAALAEGLAAAPESGLSDEREKFEAESWETYRERNLGVLATRAEVLLARHAWDARAALSTAPSLSPSEPDALAKIAAIMREEHDKGDGHFSTEQVLLMEKLFSSDRAASAPSNDGPSKEGA